MTANLEQNLYVKHKLRFQPNGKFRILMVSDIQETLLYDKRTLRSFDKLVETTMPDLILLGGDNCDGTRLHTQDELQKYLDIFTSPMENRQIPWAHIFGNHDHDMEFDDVIKTQLYEKYPFCVSKHTNHIYGTTNFVLPILHSYNDRIAFAAWGMDTNNQVSDDSLSLHPGLRAPQSPIVSRSFDYLHFDQLMWYWNSSIELEKHNGSPIPGMMFMHIAPWEAQYLVDYPEFTQTRGNMTETMGLGRFNSGIFAAVKQRGDIRCIASGHSHHDCFSGSYCGITICLDACAGYSPYGTDELRGGRIFEIDEQNPETVHTYMVHYKDL